MAKAMLHATNLESEYVGGANGTNAYTTDVSSAATVRVAAAAWGEPGERSMRSA